MRSLGREIREEAVSAALSTARPGRSINVTPRARNAWSRCDRRARGKLGEGALAAALARRDTGTLHRALGTALAEAPSGHNLGDVHVLVVW